MQSAVECVEQSLQVRAEQQGERTAADTQEQDTEKDRAEADAALGAEHGLTLLGIGELRLDAADVVGGALAVEPLAVHTAHQHQHEAEDRADAGKYRQS